MSTNGPVTVCVDDSPATATVVGWAASEAAIRHTALRIVTAIDDINPPLARWQLPPDFFQPVRDEAHRLLERSATVAHEVGGDRTDFRPAITKRLVHGPASAALIGESDSASLLVLGAMKAGVAARIGSVSTSVAAHADCPVAFVPDSVHDRGDEPPRVVVGVDGSSHSTEALDAAFSEADRRGASLTVVHAWQRLHADSAYVDADDNAARQRQGAEALVGEQVAGHTEQYPDLEVVQMVEEGDPADLLAAASRDADVVFVGSRGRGGFAGMLLGSTSGALISATRCPLVVVRETRVEAPHNLRGLVRRLAARI